jgi:hypothetical protein
MALTDATRLADFGSGIGTDGTLDILNLNVTGIATATTLKVGSAVTAFGGIITATTFSGALSGNATSATSATSAAGLTGTPNITVGNITASSGDLTVRNVTGVAATFTGVVSYEDVNNVDSVGVITARSGIEFGTAGVGGTITAAGQAEFAGIVTALGVNVSGIVTAASFQGSGADLTNLPASGDSNDITASLFL